MRKTIISALIAVLSHAAIAGYLYWDVETTDVQNYTVRLIAKDFEQFNHIEIGRDESHWTYTVEIKLNNRSGYIDNIVGPPNYRQNTAQYGNWNQSQYTMYDVYFFAGGYQPPTGNDVIFGFDVSGAEFLDVVQVIGDFQVRDRLDGTMNDYQGSFAYYNLDTIILPEPFTLLLFGVGGLFLRRRKKVHN